MGEVKNNIVTTWIVSEPFSRLEYSSVTNGFVDYSGGLYNNGGDNLTVEEYLKVTKTKYKNPKVVSDKEFNEMYFNSLNDSKTHFKDITEEKYYDALECLPPLRYTKINNKFHMFFISEALIADLHSCYLHDTINNKYYTAVRSISESTEFIMNVFNESLLKNN